MEKYLPFLLSVLWVIGFCNILLGISALVRPSGGRQEAPDRALQLESLDEDPLVRMPDRNQLLILFSALFGFTLFVLLPVILVFRDFIDDGSGATIFLKVCTFLFTIGTVFIYLWKRGDLRGDQSRGDT